MYSEGIKSEIKTCLIHCENPRKDNDLKVHNTGWALMINHHIANVRCIYSDRWDKS